MDAKRGSRRWLTIVVMSLVIVMLAACGGGGDTAGQTTPPVPGGTTAAETGAGATTAPEATMEPESEAEPATEAAPAEDATAEPAATEVMTDTTTAGGETASPGTIRMAVVRGAMIETMEELASKYEAANPGVTVQVEEEPEGGAFEALIAAGNQPDIIVASFGSQVGRLAATEAVVPLEDLEGADELFGSINEAMVEELYGHNYYVPVGADVTMMIYNKEIFEEAGLDPEDPPATYAEFLDAAEKIQALPARDDGAKVYGTVFWNEALAWGGWYWNMLQPIYLNANNGECKLLNRLGTDIVFDDPECNMESFFEFTAAAQKFAPPTMEKNFFSRTFGMWPQYGYSWEPNLQEAAGQPMVIGEDVGVAPVPVAEEGQTSYTTLGGRALMIMKTTPDRQASAWGFVRFLMEPENNLQFLTELGYLPTLTSLNDDPYFAEPARKPFVDALQNAVLPQQFATADAVANSVLGVYQEAVVQGATSPADAVTSAAEKARAELQKAGTQ